MSATRAREREKERIVFERGCHDVVELRAAGREGRGKKTVDRAEV